ncbi:hypothetical protein K504DRAFT_367652 [Pleomassaria siparia CBS 279.74]|uniref:Secreted protein n=1 Tax=Pleomassaria siparia CBS 279.74 TaxID=1314801 RepID=A0A6G1KPC8_9PLEO|nr:hypothetical protein K504DRAFT_367652 [Pleomassaria siparia CBS 279.74]
MRSTLLLAAVAAAPALIAAAPGVSPRITNLRISGSGCPNDSGSVKASTGVLGDSANFSFSQLSGDTTDNCEIHIQSTGGSQGWQVAVQAVTYSGDLTLKPGTQLDTFTQIYWSDKAAETSTLTGHITCTGPEIRDSFTLRQSTNDLKYSKCTAGDGNPGILNVNFRPVISGKDGTYNVKSATWNLVWRQC